MPASRPEVAAVTPQPAPLSVATPAPEPKGQAAGQLPAKPERRPIERPRSEEYYDVKTTVFNALIDTIDLMQLAKLEPDAAREEIRDIVSEIVAIKNVVMSIAEQEELLEDICNDVLGYGPFEPLLARDDIADIMVNGAEDDLHRGRRQGRGCIDPLRRQRATHEERAATVCTGA